MKLSGNYDFETLARTLQGNFACTDRTRNSRGALLPPEQQCIRLELFFLAIEFYKNTGEVKVFSVSEDENGVKKMTPICTLSEK